MNTRFFVYPTSLLLSVGLIVLILLLFPTGQAEARAAHAQYDHSSPAANARLPGGHPPTLVQVWFTEQIEPAFSHLSVYNTQKVRVDLNNSHPAPDSTFELDVSLPPHLPDGTYTVVFENVSADDGHHVEGAFGFVVGAGPLPTDTSALLAQSAGPDSNFNAWSVVIRWWNYLAMAALTGLLLFLMLVWRPARSRVLKRVGPRLAQASARVERQTRIALLISWGMLVIGWAGMLVYQAAVSSESAPWNLLRNHALAALLFQSRFGAIWLVRAGLMIVAGAVVLGPRPKARRTPALPLWLLFALSLGIILTTSLNAHAAGSESPGLLVLADFLHLACAGVWIGGLVALVLVIPPGLRELQAGTGDRTRVLAAIIPRFSVAAFMSVILLMGTGTLLAVVQIDSWSALVTNLYGQVLLLKLGLFCLLLLAGVYHFLRVSPRMRRFAAQAGEEKGSAGSLQAGLLQRRFRRTVALECAGALLLLGVVGGLTSLSPPPHATASAGQTVIQSQGTLADLTYRMVINPGVPGSNTFEVVLTQHDGTPLLKAEAVIVRLQMLDMEMGIQEMTLRPVARQPGHYAAVTSDLSMTGHWRITLLVRRAGFDDGEVSFPANIAL